MATLLVVGMKTDIHRWTDERTDWLTRWTDGQTEKPADRQTMAGVTDISVCLAPHIHYGKVLRDGVVRVVRLLF